jgi:PAS domain S-box-containing protein
MTANAIREALTTAMMHCAAPMVLSDPNLPDCPMVAANPAFADLTGYPLGEIVGRNCRFLQGPNTDAFSRRRIRASLEAGQGCIEWIVNYRRDGAMFWNLLFISPVRDADGTLVFFFGNQLDITLGFPNWVVELKLGRAHVVPELEAEFHALLREVSVAQQAQALERIVAAAHRLAEISTSLTPGILGQAKDGQPPNSPPVTVAV